MPYSNIAIAPVGNSPLDYNHWATLAQSTITAERYLIEYAREVDRLVAYTYSTIQSYPTVETVNGRTFVPRNRRESLRAEVGNDTAYNFYFTHNPF